jgi:mitochondrial cardiolipin hydrolase
MGILRMIFGDNGSQHARKASRTSHERERTSLREPSTGREALDAPTHDIEVYFSPSDDCLNAIIAALNVARRKADICVFTISDDRITNAIKLCHKRGVRVRVISDNDQMNNKGSDVAELAEHGIDVHIDRTQYHMHHKFAVIDDKMLLTGSYNWTRQAANSNEENLMVLRESRTLKAFGEEFARLWARTEVL